MPPGICAAATGTWNSRPPIWPMKNNPTAGATADAQKIPPGHP